MVSLVFREVGWLFLPGSWVAAHTVPPELFSESADVFSSKFPFFFFFLLQDLSILHHHNFIFPLQPPLIDKGTCFSPGHLDVILRIEIFVARSLFNSHTVFLVYLQMLVGTGVSHAAFFSFAVTITWTQNKEVL